MRPPDTINWRRGLLGAALWGGIVALADGFDQPFGELSWREMVSFTFMVGSTNLAIGLVWALGVELPASARRPLHASALLFLIALPVSLLDVAAVSPWLRPSSSIGVILLRPTLQDIGWHNVWIDLFYGGVFAAAYHLTRRMLELRRRLAALRLARNEADMRLREARLRALQEQMRPASLLEALRTLQQRYATDPAAADQLFEALVAFLREIMPGLRGHSDQLPTAPPPRRHAGCLRCWTGWIAPFPTTRRSQSRPRQ